MIRLRVLAALGLITACHGCGGPPAIDRSDVIAQYNAGVKAFAESNYGEAATKLSAAIDQGGLSADQYVDAHVRRALCRAVAKDYAGAHADLDRIEPGAANLDAVYSARAFVLNKEGKSAKAAAAMAKARITNPHVQPFQE